MQGEHCVQHQQLKAGMKSSLVYTQYSEDAPRGGRLLIWSRNWTESWKRTGQQIELEPKPGPIYIAHSSEILLLAWLCHETANSPCLAGIDWHGELAMNEPKWPQITSHFQRNPP